MARYNGTMYPEVDCGFIKEEEIDGEEIDIEYHNQEDMCPDVSIQDLLEEDITLRVNDVSPPDKCRAATLAARVQHASPGQRYQCHACHRSYKLRGHLSRHIKLDHLELTQPRLMYCDNCSFFTKHKWSLIRHIARKHTGQPAMRQVEVKSSHHIVIPMDGPPLPFACCRCSKSYKHQFALRRHEKLECRRDRAVSYHCETEAGEAADGTNLSGPMFVKVEALDNPGSDLDDPGYDDPGLDYSGADNPGMDDREVPDGPSGTDTVSVSDALYKSLASSPRPRSPIRNRALYGMHTCPTCCQRLRNKRSVELHAKYGCGGASKHFKQCSHCEYCTDQTWRMEHHLATHHVAECYPDREVIATTCVKCPVCNRRLKSKSSLLAHCVRSCRARTHKFSCLHCPYRGRRQHNLRSHIANNHPKPVAVAKVAAPASRLFQCNICLRSYKNRGDVNRHARLCGTNPQYVCGTCGRTYRHQYGLDRHMSVECGQLPTWSCDRCPFRTKRSFSLKMHEQLVSAHDKIISDL